MYKGRPAGNPQPALRVRVRRGSEKVNPYPYPCIPYPQPVRVLKPVTITIQGYLGIHHQIPHYVGEVSCC
jgi:hypothetical protein